MRAHERINDDDIDVEFFNVVDNRFNHGSQDRAVANLLGKD